MRVPDRDAHRRRLRGACLRQRRAAAAAAAVPGVADGVRPRLGVLPEHLRVHRLPRLPRHRLRRQHGHGLHAPRRGPPHKVARHVPRGAGHLLRPRRARLHPPLLARHPHSGVAVASGDLHPPLPAGHGGRLFLPRLAAVPVRDGAVRKVHPHPHQDRQGQQEGDAQVDDAREHEGKGSAAHPRARALSATRARFDPPLAMGAPIGSLAFSHSVPSFALLSALLSALLAALLSALLSTPLLAPLSPPLLAPLRSPPHSPAPRSPAPPACSPTWTRTRG